MALAFDAASSVTGFSVKWAHTCTGSNRALIVSITLTGTENAFAVFYNGVPLTFIGSISANSTHVEQWKLSNPDSGTHDIVVYTAAVAELRAGAVSFTGAHQTTASLTGTQATATGTDNSPTVNVSSATGEIVIDGMEAFDDVGGAHSHTVGGGQTERWSFDTADLGTQGGSTEAGAASVTMSWSLTGEIGGWCIAGVPVKPAGGDTLAFDAVSSSSAASSGTVIFSNHVCGGANRALIVGLQFENVGGQTITGVTYNGVAMTSIGGITVGGMGHRAEQWKLSAPDSGAHDIEVTLSASTSSISIGGVSFTGAHQTTGSLTGTQATNNGFTTTPTVNVSSAAGEIVIDDEFGFGSNLTVGAGQTIRCATPNVSTEAGAGSVTMSWSTSDTEQWLTAGVSVKEAPPAGFPFHRHPMQSHLVR